MNVGKYYAKRFSTYKKTKSEKDQAKITIPKSNDLKESLRAVMRGRGSQHGRQA